MQRSVGIWREDVERRRLDPLLDSPFDCAFEDVGDVMVHPEDEAAVHHHAELVQSPDRGRVVSAYVLVLALLLQVVAVDRLKADKQAAQPRSHSFLEHPRLFEDRLDRTGRLPHAVHATHAVEQRLRKRRAAEEVVVEKVQMPSRKPVDLGQGRVDGLRVELLASFEESDLVAEVTYVRAAARDDDRVGHEVQPPLDQVAADGRHAEEGAVLGDVPGTRPTGPEISQELRPRVLARTKKYRVRVLRRLLGQRGDMQTSQCDMASA